MKRFSPDNGTTWYGNNCDCNDNISGIEEYLYVNWIQIENFMEDEPRKVVEDAVEDAVAENYSTRLEIYLSHAENDLIMP